MNKKALWITIIAVVVIGILVAKGGMAPQASMEPTPVVVDDGTITPTPSEPLGKLPAGSTPPGDPKELSGTWVWVRTVMRNGSTITPQKAGKFTMTFDTQGHVGGGTDCNGYGGDYTVGSDGVIKMGSFISTQMYCEGSQEAVFTGQLMKANRYAFDVGPNLQLDFGDGTGTMIFTKK